MKARPRYAENQTVSELNKFFTTLGLDPVERLPITGRTGPDLGWNDFKLICDCKSRLEIPKGNVGLEVPTYFGPDMLGIPLTHLSDVGSPIAYVKPSKTVHGYLEHMESWTRAHVRDGISCIMLHRPKLPYGKSTLLIYSTDLRRFNERISKYSNLQLIN